VGVGRRVDAFIKYRQYLKPGLVLDWGCKHSIDGCLVKATMGEEVQLYGCDVGQNDFAAFHTYAGLKFTELKHPYQLPYDDNEFDVVIGSGVLEHVPNDSESLKELYRILKPGGRLILTFLPNHYSYTEALVSALDGPSHKRTYRASEIRNEFLHHGFLPILIGYHQVTPSLSSLGSKSLGDRKLIKSAFSFLYKFNRTLENIWLIRMVAANLLIVADKVEHF
jgi:ubiquinone/menaquinone biosynthesis C-methylase UbiE